ncbi:MAG: hypothetical protein V2G42_02150 [bacterium JZ-2024 1]
MKFWERLASLDRRWLFLVLAVAILFPLFRPLHIPVGEGRLARKFYDRIEAIPSGSTILVCFTFGPSAYPELYPAASATIAHALRRGLRVITMALHPEAEPYFAEITERLSREMGKKYGEDYINLGFKPGAAFVILQMGEDIVKAYPNDALGRPTASYPLMAHIKNFNDLALVVDFGAGDSPEWWVAYGNARYGVELMVGATAVMVAQFYPYLQTGQITSLLGGIRGAAEYEKIVYGYNLPVTVKMSDSQSLAHFTIILFILFGNLGYFMTRQKQRATSAK